ncbi:hypothetical protein ACT80S_18360 [Ramlibacter sp. MAHUQ-53]|uniref:hypothetical protein n=1 Tax=unclassified Ramlibacter TaxID=2617605 RepID=UPI00362C6435
MTEQHTEAQRLAALMDAMDYDDTRQAAAELRRLEFELSVTEMARGILMTALVAQARDVQALDSLVADLSAVLRLYADANSWTEDANGVLRVWLEPGSETPEQYNGFEFARTALAASEAHA